MTNKDEVLGFLQSSRVDRIAAYAQAGRRHAGLSLDALNADWTAAFRAMTASPSDAAAHAAHTEYESEFELRSIEPPYHFVKEEMEAFFAAVDRAFLDMKTNDPTRMNEANEKLEQDLAEFRSKLKGRS